MSESLIFIRWRDLWLVVSGRLAMCAVIGAIGVVGLWLVLR
jgi:hypothetical protein